jgi:hypothetical protein
MAGILGRKDHTGAVADRVTSGGRQGQGVAAANERLLERVSAEDEPCAKKGGYLSGDSKVSSEVSSTPLRSRSRGPRKTAGGSEDGLDDEVELIFSGSRSFGGHALGY